MITSPTQAQQWLVDVAGYAPREDWGKLECIEETGDGFFNMVFRDASGKVSGCRERDKETIEMLKLATA
jgi:hypothetical protein